MIEVPSACLAAMLAIVPSPPRALENTPAGTNVRFSLPVDAFDSTSANRVTRHLTFLTTPTARQAAPTPVAVSYSDGYRVRAKIHKVASVAMLPLVVTEGILGQSLYNDPTSGKRDAHLAVATAIGGLFAINTVTGVWNLVESRGDPNGRKRRLWHGVLMLVADAAFFATPLLAPEGERDGEGGESGGGSRAAHRAMAFTSLGAATAGYLVMLLGGH